MASKKTQSRLEKEAERLMQKELRQPGKENKAKAKALNASRRGSPIRPTAVVTPKKVKESRRARIKAKMRKEEW